VRISGGGRIHFTSVVSLVRVVHNERLVRFTPLHSAPNMPVANMPVSQTFRDWVREQLAPSVPKLHDRSMFGGVGIYAGELFFALLDNDRLYLKVDDSNRADFVAAGMGPFQPFGDDPMTMQYYEVPLEVIERPPELAEWVAKAVAVARAAASKKTRKPVKSKTSSRAKAVTKSARPTKQKKR